MALVCGASQGIGAAVAQALAAEGASVVALARTESKLKQLLQSLNGPQTHHYIAVDIGERAQVKTEVEKVLAKVGAIHILVNNSGGPPGGSISEAKEDEFVRAFEHHVLAGHMLTQILLPGMKKEKYGRILNIISTSVKVPIPNLGVSNTIRAATANWAKTMANEVGQFGITVNNILPGFVTTQRHEERLHAIMKQTGKSAEVITQEWLKTVPVGRFGEPQDVGAAAAFLASPLAGYIHGINLPVDGGRLGCL